MVYVLALAASLANALTCILQRIGVEKAPGVEAGKVRLILDLVRSWVWLAGLALMLVAFAAQAVALHLGRLTVVQPLLTSELLFLVLILGIWFQFHLGWREWVGSLAAAGGLAGFLYFASPTGGNTLPSNAGWAAAGLACMGVIGLAYFISRRGPRWWRAAVLGFAAGIGYSFSAALTKADTAFIAHDWVSLFWHWETYGLVFFGVVALYLTQLAYQAGPIAASQAAMVLVDPLASILIGIWLLGDNLRTNGFWGPLEAISLLIMFIGVFILSISPLVGGVKSEGNEGDAFLTVRRRNRQASMAAAKTEV